MIKRTQQRHLYFALCTLLYLVLTLAVVACGKSPATQQPYAVGQTAEVDGWKITVHGLFLLPADEWHQPEDGNVFCAVELTLENAGGRIRYVMPEKQIRLLDEAKRVIPADHEAGLMAARSRQWYVPQGEVGDGKIPHGALAYQIPAGSRDLSWTFRSGLLPWSKTVVFALGEVPHE